MQKMQETRVAFLGPGEEPLEEEMATHSSILAWKIPWTEDPGGLQSMELQRVRPSWSDGARTCTQQGKVAQNHVSYNVSDGNQWKGAHDKLLKIVLNFFFLLSYVLPSAKCPSLSYLCIRTGSVAWHLICTPDLRRISIPTIFLDLLSWMTFC